MGLFSSPKPPPPPDLVPAAEKTTAGNVAAAKEQTLQDRPDQVDIYGNRSTWTTDPVTGRPIQTQTAGGVAQAGQDAVTDAYGRATDALGQPIDFSGLTKIGDYDTGALQGVDAEGLRAGAGLFNLDPMGNAKEIQDATYGLLRPQREMATNAELQRLASQGLTEDSPAWQAAMLRQNQADTDAQLKSLLAGQQEYGNQFARAMGQNQQNFGQRSAAEDFAMKLRGQQFGEQGSQLDLDRIKRETERGEMMYQREQPLSELQALISGASGYGGPAFGSFQGATVAKPTDYLQLEKDKYGIGAENAAASAAAKANKTSGLVSLAGTAAVLI